jgi:hypothetical protein
MKTAHQHMKLLASALALLASASFLQAAQKPLLREFIGINGHFQFKPELYKQNCRLVRNYHNINWDVKKPGDQLTFPICPNKVNWDTHVYGKWQKHGFEVDLCAQFGGFGEGNEKYKELWAGQEQWIGSYGKKMAKYFGPSGKRKLVTSIEIGNEPGNDFDDTLYKKLFVSMAKGIRAGDPKIKIVTATAQSGASDKYSKSLEETFSSPQMMPLYDVINVHVYAAKPKKKGQSPWDRSYPEDPNIEYLKIVDKVIDWRNRAAAGKEIWITEFGYDACTPEAMKKREGWAKKLNWQGVTDLQQAQYIIRSIFCFAERDINRAYIYFFNDDDKASVHASAGLTRKFKPKPSFWAVKHLYETLGDYRLSRVVPGQDKSIRVFEFTHATDKNLGAWIAWSPTGQGISKDVTLQKLPAKPIRIERMPLTDGAPPKVTAQMGPARSCALKVTESPTYLFFDLKRR